MLICMTLSLIWQSIYLLKAVLRRSADCFDQLLISMVELPDLQNRSKIGSLLMSGEQ